MVMRFYFFMMSKTKKSKLYNLLFLVCVALFLIPQTRQPIQVFLNKILATVITPSVVKEKDRKTISNYNWQLQDQSGASFDFNAAKGKIVVINFWATWCPPCVAEMPSLEALYKTYKDRDEILFLFVSSEANDAVMQFMAKNNYSFKVYKPLTGYPEDFNVTSIPRTFVIDNKGHIVIDTSGAADWTSDTVIATIDKLLTAF